MQACPIGRPGSGSAWPAQLRGMLACFAVFGIQARYELIHTGHIIDLTDALASRPYSFPRFGLIAQWLELGTEVDFTFALKRSEVKPGIFQALAHEAGRYAGDCWSVHDVGGARCEQHLLIGIRCLAFGGADKARAEISEVCPQHLGG